MRRTMLDQCPVSPYSEVSRMITEELGSAPEELFASFEETPIASASLAQVRHASRASDCDYTCRTQHPWKLAASSQRMRWKVSFCRCTELLAMMANS